MAISNTFNTSNQYIKYRIVVTENSYSIANNTSNVTVQVQAWRTNKGYTTDGNGTCYCIIDGATYSNSWKYNDGHAITYNSYTVLFSKTLTITHNANGAKSINVTAYINHATFDSGTNGFSVALTTIPRYATANQSLASKTETSIQINWSSDSTIDYVWYSINNGSTWTALDSVNASSGSYTISGLTANTTYNIKTRVRRKDSQLTTDSSALSVATYNYPYANSMPNFTIGNVLTIGLYNPLNRSVTVQIIGNDNSIVDTWTGTGTTIIGYNAATTINNFYASIPNSKTGTYKVKVVYGSSTITNTGGTYSINENECKPSITSGSYQDTNSSVIAITGNNQKIVRNQSIVQYTATGLTTKKSATISSCSVMVNGNSYNLSVSGTSATGGNAVIDSASNVTATFTLTDSRGLTATKNITINMLDWTLPSAIITCQRHNNFYSETDINVNADYSSLDGNNQITITYCYKKLTDSTYSSNYPLSDDVTSTFSIDNAYQWNVKVVVSDLFGSTTYNLTVPKGTPIIFFDRLLSSTGFNCFPQNDNSVEINDQDMLKRIAGYGEIANQVTGDWNTACGTASGIYMGVDLLNAPSSGWWYVLHIVHNNLYQRQIAFSFTDSKKIYSRTQDFGTWNNWTLLINPPKLLWTNSSPNSSFATQTINLNSDDYNLLKIYYKKTNSENNLSSVEIIKGYDTDIGYIDDSCVVFSRHVESVTDTSLEFGGGNRLMPNGTASVADDTRCIPLYIVGYKSDLF